MPQKYNEIKTTLHPNLTVLSSLEAKLKRVIHPMRSLRLSRRENQKKRDISDL